jgi:ankyrin repeat protein
MGKTGTAELLVAKGACVDTRDKDGDTALMDAAVMGEVESVRFLIGKKADLDAKDHNGGTALSRAAGKRGEKIAELLIEAGAEVNTADEKGWTPLMTTDSSETARLLIAHGADVDARNAIDGTPLMNAAIFGNDDVAKLLLANGADVNAVDRNGCTALLLASSGKDLAIVKLLVAKGARVNVGGAGETPLKNAIRNNNPDIEAFLIAHGADVNARDVHERTPLMDAVVTSDRYGTKSVELLLRKGARVNLKDDSGSTAMTWAVALRRWEAAALLKRHGGRE